MKIDKRNIETTSEIIPGGGWCGKEKIKIKRNPWVGLTPEEAYRKGEEQGREFERDQQFLRDQLNNPKLRPRC